MLSTSMERLNLDISLRFSLLLFLSCAWIKLKSPQINHAPKHNVARPSSSWRKDSFRARSDDP